MRLFRIRRTDRCIHDNPLFSDYSNLEYKLPVITDPGFMFPCQTSSIITCSIFVIHSKCSIFAGCKKQFFYYNVYLLNILSKIFNELKIRIAYY